MSFAELIRDPVLNLAIEASTRAWLLAIAWVAFIAVMFVSTVKSQSANTILQCRYRQIGLGSKF